MKSDERAAIFTCVYLDYWEGGARRNNGCPVGEEGAAFETRRRQTESRAAGQQSSWELGSMTRHGQMKGEIPMRERQRVICPARCRSGGEKRQQGNRSEQERKSDGGIRT